jgi:hypothetical protein
MKKIYYLIAMAVTAFTFTSCEDVPEPFGQPINPNAGSAEVIEPKGTGTADDPLNIAAAIAKCKEVGETASTEKYYIKGVSQEEYTVSSYKNIELKIYDTEDSKAAFTIFRCKGAGGVEFEEGQKIAKGSVFIVYGPVVNYKGNTPETSNGAYIVSINGVPTGGGGGGDTPTGETIGTKEAPLTIAQALEKINALEDGKESELNAYVKGKVVKVTTSQANFEKYGNLNYLISEDGTETNAITVYSGDGLDGAKFTGIDALGAGDEVIVFGKLYKYVKDSKVTPEIAKGNYLVSLVKAGSGGDTPSGDAAGSGTQADPYNVAAIVEIASKLGDKEVSTEDYYIKGKICSIKFEYSAQYGTATFNISEDGKTGGTEFTAYSVYYFDNKSWVEGNTQIAVGNDVVLHGKITNYGGTLETASKKAYLYSLNGKTSEGGGSGSSTGTLDNPLTASQLYDIVAAMESGTTSTEDYYVKGKICSIKYEYSAQYGTATFNITDDGNTGSKEFIAYSTYYHASEQKWKEGDTQIAVGNEVVICGKVVNYSGNTPEFASKKSYVVTINGK